MFASRTRTGFGRLPASSPARYKRFAPCTEFDSPRYGLEIKRQVDTNIYLSVTYGGGAENRTPVHESPLIGISKLSRWFCLGRFARSDTLAAS